MITRLDVIEVGNQIGKCLSESDIDEVLAIYPNEQDNDPTATWNLVIENCIYNVINVINDNNLKTIKNKYSEVVEKMKILQITNNAIQEGIIKKMLGKEQFTDTTTNGDLIYSGSVFQEILHESMDENMKTKLSKKVLEQLTELIILCYKYEYIMLIDNPK